MASYLQPPNANSYNFRPYELPVQQIAQAISARSQFWEISAAQVKSAYEQAAGLTLSRKESKMKLQEFMTAADDQMRKASRTELSIGENQKKAINIMKPLYQDQTLMLDHSLTEFYAGEGQRANNAKMRDGGKEFSQDNFGYMQQKYNDFVSDPNYDVNTLQKHYNERRGYTPYHNYHPEFENITKLCKPGSMSSQTPIEGSLYFDVRSDKSLSDAKLAGCLQAGLSSKAKTQMQIEGYMAYGKDYKGVALDYIRHSDSEIATFDKTKSAIDGRLAALRAKANRTPQEDLQIAQLEQSSNEYGEYMTEQVKERNVVAGGNLDYVRQNYEKLAGSLYMRRKIGEYSNANAYPDESRKVEENNAAMLQYRTQAEVNNLAKKFEDEKFFQKQDFMFDVSLEAMRQQGAMNLQDLRNQGAMNRQMQRIQKADGTWISIPIYPDVLAPANQADLQQNSKTLFDQRYSEAVSGKKQADQFLFNQFKNVFPRYQHSTPDALISSPEMQNYIKANPGDQNVKAWLNEARKHDQNIVKLEAFKMNVEEALQRENPDDLKNNVTGLSNVRLPNGTVLTPDQIMNGIKGTDPNIRVVLEGKPGESVNAGPNASGRSANTYVPVVYMNGQRITVPNLGQNWNLTEVMHRVEAQKQNLDKKRNELYATRFFQLEGRKDIGADNDNKDHPLKARIGARAGVDPSQVILQETDQTGTVWMKIAPDKEGNLPDNLLETLNQGFKVDKEGDRFKLAQVPEYTFFNGNDRYKEMLGDINSFITVNRGKLNRDQTVEIPIRSEYDTRTNSPSAAYKLAIKKGPGSAFLYKIHKRGADGNYVPSIEEISNEYEAIKLIEMFDKYDSQR